MRSVSYGKILGVAICVALIGRNAVYAADFPLRGSPFNGSWDERGAPQGKLLTDNGGWWGERPYKCNFLKLRDKALDAFGRVAIER